MVLNLILSSQNISACKYGCIVLTIGSEVILSDVLMKMSD